MAFSQLHPAYTDDQELLSAYLDNQLSVAERVALERRLQVDQQLQVELQELRAVKTLLGDLQPVVPPRSFTLDPATVQRPRGLPLFNLFRLGSALATVLLVLTFTVDFITTSPSARPEITAAQAPVAANSASTLSAPNQPAPAANEAGQSATGGGAAAALAAPTVPAPAFQAPADAADQSSAYARQGKLQSSSATTDTTQAASSSPPEVVQPGQLHASDSSSPGTGDSALPSQAESSATGNPSSSAPASNTPLRWVQLALGIVAVGLALGAWVAWRQSR